MRIKNGRTREGSLTSSQATVRHGCKVEEKRVSEFQQICSKLSNVLKKHVLRFRMPTSDHRYEPSNSASFHILMRLWRATSTKNSNIQHAAVQLSIVYTLLTNICSRRTTLRCSVKREDINSLPPVLLSSATEQWLHSNIFDNVPTAPHLTRDLSHLFQESSKLLFSV